MCLFSEAMLDTKQWHHEKIVLVIALTLIAFKAMTKEWYLKLHR